MEITKGEKDAKYEEPEVENERSRHESERRTGDEPEENESWFPAQRERILLRYTG